MDVIEDPLNELLEQFCEYDYYYHEWRWKIESLYELTEEELNILHNRAADHSMQPIRIDHSIFYHLAKKILLKKS